MVNVGIIGPGLVWETRYRPAIQKLGSRIGVRAVYDPVAARCEQIAAELGAIASPGILALAEHPSVQAVLLLDPGWAGHHVVDLLCHSSRPVYVAGSLGCGLEELRRLQQRTTTRHLTLMPEFTLRHTPATARLQELMATKLGRPKEIVIEAVAPAAGCESADPGGTLTSGTDFLVGLLDWCQYVVRTQPISVHAKPIDSSAEKGQPSPARRATIVFAQPRKGGAIPQVDVVLKTPAPAIPSGNGVPASSEAQSSPLTSEVVCERGRASLRSASEIVWTNGSAEVVTETLTSDRSAVEVMLDHFCRRVVGGLIPVADLGDVCRGVGLARAVEHTLKTGETVSLAGMT